jgi:hypothetical protein
VLGAPPEPDAEQAASRREQRPGEEHAEQTWEAPSSHGSSVTTISEASIAPRG